MKTSDEAFKEIMDKLEPQLQERLEQGDLTQVFRSIWELSGTFNDLNPYHDRLCYGVFWKDNEFHYDFYNSWNEASAGMAKRLKEDAGCRYRLLTNTIWKALWNEYEFFQFLALMTADEKECYSYVDKATEIASYMLDPV